MTEGQNLFHQLKTARDSGDFLNKHLQHQKQQSSRKLMELLTKETVHSEKLMVIPNATILEEDERAASAQLHWTMLTICKG